MSSEAERGTVLVPSVNPATHVAVSGLDLNGDAREMISWLGRGTNHHEFVTHDVERELYSQTPGAQLLSLDCSAPPRFETDAVEQGPGAGYSVTAIKVTFPLDLRIRTSDDILWKLQVDHCYEALNVHRNDARRQLKLHFTVTAHEQLST